jgi:hypothetical protein
MVSVAQPIEPQTVTLAVVGLTPILHPNMAYKNKEDQAAASKRYYEANKEKYLAQVKVISAKQKQAIRQLIDEYLSTHPCLVCGEDDPVVLEFDHRDRETKEFTISEAVGRKMSVQRVQSEIDKCDVLCANCHRRRTHQQMGWRDKTHTPNAAFV